MPRVDRATQILQKGSTSFAAPDYFGTSPDLITAMKNVGVSNLEEQLLLGVNYISYSWVDNTEAYGLINRVQKEFRTKDQKDGFYYILDSSPNGIIADEDMAYLNGDILFIPGDNGDSSGTADDSWIDEDTLIVKSEPLGDYRYSIDAEAGVLIIETDRDDFNQMIEQVSLWYKPVNAKSDNDDKLIAILTVTPEYNLDNGKIMQVRKIDSCWSTQLNDYPRKTEAELTWQII